MKGQTSELTHPNIKRQLWLWFIPFALLVLGAVFLGRFLGKDPTVINNKQLGQAFPLFNLSELQTEQPLNQFDLPKKTQLVNVWASWCATCKQEHPLLMQHKQQGITIVGINYKDELVDARNYLSHKGNPNTLNIYDPDGNLSVDLGITGTPESFIVDRNGVIRFHYIGGITEQDWVSVLKPCFDAVEHAGDLGVCKQ